MALFRRSKREAPRQPEAREETIDIELATARPVVEMLSHTSSDAQVRGGIYELRKISGAPLTDQDELRAVMDGGTAQLAKPWRWLAAVAQEANAQGDHHVAAQAFFFTNYYMFMLVPRMKLADFLEVGLDPAPDQQLQALAREGVIAGEQLPGDFVVAGDATGSITADQILGWAAPQTGHG